MSDLISQSKPLFNSGSVVSQVVLFDGAKRIDKISLSLSVTTAEEQTMIIGSNGVLSFQAANFREGRDTWAFQPAIHWIAPSWETSGTTVKNSGQIDFYTTTDEAALYAPYIQYDLFLDLPGVYDLWGYGYTSSEGAFWAWDQDTSHMRRLVLGNPSGPPEWTKVGSIYSQEGGQHTLSIYLSNASDVVLDQWYITQERDHDQYLASAGLERSPLSPLSKSPFNTALRTRSLNHSTLDELDDPVPESSILTSWLSSKNIVASGKYNYQIGTGSGATYNDGVALDFWQIGGSSLYFVSWDFIFTNTSVGDAFFSSNYGQDFSVL